MSIRLDTLGERFESRKKASTLIFAHILSRLTLEYQTRIDCESASLRKLQVEENLLKIGE